MFDKSPFDSVTFNRIQNFEIVESAIKGDSSLYLDLVIQMYLDSFTMGGSTKLSATPIAKQNIKSELTSVGTFEIRNAYLRLELTSKMAGTGSLKPGIGIKVPFTASLSGSSAMSISNKVYLLQTVIADINSKGTVNSSVVLKMNMISNLYSNSNLSIDNRLKLLLPLKPLLKGAGDILIKRIGTLNSEFIAFDNLNLLPGQTLIIDTDELNVFVDNFMNVDSVTSDSTFFQLKPGDNQIKFDSDVNHLLSVTVIWNNRWL